MAGWGAQLSAPGAWINADDPAKDTREVGLISHTTVEGDLRQRRPGTQHERLCVLDSLPRDVGEWSITEALSKSMEEMPAAQSCGASKVNDPNSGADVGRNVRDDVLLLPRCETASNRGFGLDRESLDGAVQKLRGALKAGFRSSAIAVQRSGRYGDEHRQRAAAETVPSCVRYGGGRGMFH